MMEFPGLGKFTEMFIVSHVHFLHYTSTRKIMKLLLQCVYIHAAGYWIGVYVYLLICISTNCKPSSSGVLCSGSR